MRKCENMYKKGGKFCAMGLWLHMNGFLKRKWMFGNKYIPTYGYQISMTHDYELQKMHKLIVLANDEGNDEMLNNLLEEYEFPFRLDITTQMWVKVPATSKKEMTRDIRETHKKTHSKKLEEMLV